MSESIIATIEACIHTARREHINVDTIHMSRKTFDLFKDEVNRAIELVADANPPPCSEWHGLKIIVDDGVALGTVCLTNGKLTLK